MACRRLAARWGAARREIVENHGKAGRSRAAADAVARVRGGGDNGEEWDQAGMKLKKQNTIDDFVGCAKYLVEKKYTSSPRLAGSGTSAGGITIGGAITQHRSCLPLRSIAWGSRT